MKYDLRMSWVLGLITLSLATVQILAGQPPTDRRGLNGGWIDSQGNRFVITTFYTGSDVRFDGLAPQMGLMSLVSMRLNCDKCRVRIGNQDYPLPGLVDVEVVKGGGEKELEGYPNAPDNDLTVRVSIVSSEMMILNLNFRKAEKKLG